jgi:predicted phosphodiesterase
MNGTTFLDEVVARLNLGEGAGTLILLVVPPSAEPEAIALRLEFLLRLRGLEILSLRYGSAHDPADWVEASQELADTSTTQALITWIVPAGELEMQANARLYNAKRELLRQLCLPLLIVVQEKTAACLGEFAPDFCSWAAWQYAVSVNDLPKSSLISGSADPSVAERNSQPPIRFLHLSDFHLRTEKRKQFDQDKVLGGLLDMLAKIPAEDSLDLVFFSGDLAFSGKSEEYELVRKWLKALLEATRIRPEHLFVVPGNHDADRKVGQWLLRTLPSDEVSADFFTDEGHRAFHLRKFSAYHESLSELLGNRGLGLQTGAAAVETVDIRGTAISVASFNSAWFALDDTDQGALWLGEANVSEAAKSVREPRASLAIALFHHPTEYLADHERSYVENHLERSFDLVLRGHLHRDKVTAGMTARGGYLEVACPAGYQGSQWPNGCFLGEIDVDRRTVRLGAWAFGSGADPWVPNPRIFPDDAADSYRHTFALPWREKTPARPWVDELVPVMERIASQIDAKRQWGVDPQELIRQGRARELWLLVMKLRTHAPELGRELIRHVPPQMMAGKDLASVLRSFVAFWREHGDRWVAELGDVERALEIAFYAFVEWHCVTLPRPGFHIWFVSDSKAIDAHGAPYKTEVMAVVDQRPNLPPLHQRVRLEEQTSWEGLQQFVIWS